MSQDRLTDDMIACSGLQMQGEHTAALELLHGRIAEANRQTETTRQSLNSAKQERRKLKSQLDSSEEQCTTLVQGNIFNYRLILNYQAWELSQIHKL